MPVIFQSVLWQIAVDPPWKAKQTEHCVEINQPEGIGALHISGSQKRNGFVADDDTLGALKDEIPVDTECNSIQLGDFKGHYAEYVDWSTNCNWKKWIVGCQKVLIFATYHCKRGDEDLEANQVSNILKSLRRK